MNSRNHNSDSSRQGPILVAVDFSPDSRAALTWACEVATALGAPIVLFHVVHDPAEAPGYYRHDKKDAMRSMEDVAEKMMRKFLKEMSHANPRNKSLKNLKTELVTGLPVTRILNSPLKKALLTGFHSTAKHNATKAVSPSSETMRTI